jgi:hypothetical protein
MSIVAAMITDSHFGANNFHKGRFNSQLEFYEKQFFPYLLKHGIKDVIHLGDLVHNRNIIDLWILQEMKTRFFVPLQEMGVTFHAVVGNHDTYFKNKITHNFLEENLREFDNIIVYNKFKSLKLGKYTIGMVPWIVEPDSFDLPKKVDILCGHFEISDMQMMKNIFSHGGFDVTAFKDYRLVFSGHYHTKSSRENIHYIGTQYCLTWNDYDENKGFVVLKDNYETEFIPNTVNARFIKVYYNNGEIRISGFGEDKQSVSRDELVEIAKSNYIKLYSERCSDQLDFDGLFNSLVTASKNDYKIEVINTEQVIEDFDLASAEESLNEESSTIELIMNYIESMTFEPSIDKKLLVQLSQQLYKEAIDESMQVGD